MPGGCSSRHWFPCVDAWSELCLWKIEITVDAGLTAVCSGELEETVYTGDLRRKTFHYSLRTPTSAGNIGFAVGPFDILVHPEMNELTNFCPKGLLPLMKNSTKGLEKMFEFFEELLASRYPYGSYKQVFVEQAADELTGFASLSILSVGLLHDKRQIDPAPLCRTLLAHAVAQQFFGCFVSPHSWLDVWVAKGIARSVSTNQ